MPSGEARRLLEGSERQMDGLHVAHLNVYSGKYLTLVGAKNWPCKYTYHREALTGLYTLELYKPMRGQYGCLYAFHRETRTQHDTSSWDIRSPALAPGSWPGGGSCTSASDNGRWEVLFESSDAIPYFVRLKNKKFSLCIISPMEVRENALFELGPCDTTQSLWEATPCHCASERMNCRAPFVEAPPLVNASGDIAPRVHEACCRSECALSEAGSDSQRASAPKDPVSASLSLASGSVITVLAVGAVLACCTLALCISLVRRARRGHSSKSIAQHHRGSTSPTTEGLPLTFYGQPAGEAVVREARAIIRRHLKDLEASVQTIPDQNGASWNPDSALRALDALVPVWAQTVKVNGSFCKRLAAASDIVESWAEQVASSPESTKPPLSNRLLSFAGKYDFARARLVPPAIAMGKLRPRIALKVARSHRQAASQELAKGNAVDADAVLASLRMAADTNSRCSTPSISNAGSVSFAGSWAFNQVPAMGLPEEPPRPASATVLPGRPPPIPPALASNSPLSGGDSFWQSAFHHRIGFDPEIAAHPEDGLWASLSTRHTPSNQRMSVSDGFASPQRSGPKPANQRMSATDGFVPSRRTGVRQQPLKQGEGELQIPTFLRDGEYSWPAPPRSGQAPLNHRRGFEVQTPEPPVSDGPGFQLE